MNIKKLVCLLGSYYMHVEASSPNFPSKQAVLNSPQVNLGSYGAAELIFYYHMYGGSMESLILEASTDITTWTKVWGRRGNLGNEWYQSVVNLDQYAGQGVYFRKTGTVGQLHG